MATANLYSAYAQGFFEASSLDELCESIAEYFVNDGGWLPSIDSVIAISDEHDEELTKAEVTEFEHKVNQLWECKIRDL